MLNDDDYVKRFLAPQQIQESPDSTAEIKKQQTNLLMTYIQQKNTIHLINYLNFLSQGYPLITDGIHFSLPNNFLIESVKLNDEDIVAVLLKGLDKNSEVHVNMVLFALAYAKADTIVRLLKKFLDNSNHLIKAINTYGVFVLQLAINSENMFPTNTIAELITKHYKIKSKGTPKYTLFCLPNVFKYAILNKKFNLATIFIQLAIDPKKLLNQKDKKKIFLLHQCYYDNNLEGIKFLINHGVDLFLKNQFEYANDAYDNKNIPFIYLNILDLCIEKNDYATLKFLINQMLCSEFISKYFNNMVDFYDQCSNVNALKILNDSDFGILFNADKPPMHTDLKQISNESYQSILPLLEKYYEKKIAYRKTKTTCLPLMEKRIKELELLIDILSSFLSQKQQSLSFRYIGFRDSLKHLSPKQTNLLKTAIGKLQSLGFVIEAKTLRCLIVEINRIKSIFEKDISHFENDRSPSRQYDENALSQSLLSMLQHTDEIELDDYSDTSKGRLRKPLLYNL